MLAGVVLGVVIGDSCWGRAGSSGWGFLLEVFAGFMAVRGVGA